MHGLIIKGFKSAVSIALIDSGKTQIKRSNINFCNINYDCCFGETPGGQRSCWWSGVRFLKCFFFELGKTNNMSSNYIWRRKVRIPAEQQQSRWLKKATNWRKTYIFDSGLRKPFRIWSNPFISGVPRRAAPDHLLPAGQRTHPAPGPRLSEPPGILLTAHPR